MDELSNKLAEILNNPESMNKFKKMAESLLGEEEKPKETEQKSDLTSLINSNDMPDISEINKIMQIVSRFKSKGNDSRTALLLALKPNLSEPKQEKVDTAVKILKLIEILPFLKESGIFNL